MHLFIRFFVTDFVRKNTKALFSISGPELWGLQWPICRQGKYQSPIDIKPDRLLFDPQLTGIIFTNDRKVINPFPNDTFWNLPN